MKPHLVTLSSILLVAVALGIAAQDPEPTPKGKIYKTPQAAFEAVVAAMKKRDFKTMVEAFTPEAQKMIAADLVVQARSSSKGLYFKDKQGTKEEFTKRYKPVADLLIKHGLTDKALKDINTDNFRGDKKTREALVKLIKKPDVFAAEMMTALSKIEPGMYDGPGGDRTPKLVDVKISGDKATGNVVMTDPIQAKDQPKNIERKEPVQFVKVGAGWRINPEPNRHDIEAPEDKPAEKVKEAPKDK